MKDATQPEHFLNCGKNSKSADAIGTVPNTDCSRRRSTALKRGDRPFNRLSDRVSEDNLVSVESGG